MLYNFAEVFSFTSLYLSIFLTYVTLLSFFAFDQIKAKFMLVGTKEIKKVAEARMRKKKRAANTLKAAKKSANMMAENSEMSEKQKLKV